MSETVKDRCNAVEPVPTCSTPAAWPPPWLAAAAVDPGPAPTRPAAPSPETNEQAAAVASPAVATVSTAAAAGGNVAPGQDDVGQDDVGQDDSEPAAPCPKCGSFDLWQTIAGNWRCQHCDGAALRRSRALLERAGQLQRLARVRGAVQ